MGIRQALNIVEHMLALWFYEQGVREEEPTPLLYSLEEMVIANKKVRNRYPQKTERGYLYKLTLNDKWIAETYLKIKEEY